MSMENNELGPLKSIWASWVQKNSKDSTISHQGMLEGTLPDGRSVAEDEPPPAGLLSQLVNVLPEAFSFHKGGLGSLWRSLAMFISILFLNIKKKK